MTKGVKQLVIADGGMIRWICGVPLKDRIPTTDLLLCLGLSSISDMLMMVHGLKYVDAL